MMNLSRLNSSVQRFLLGLSGQARGRALQLRLDSGILYGLVRKSEHFQYYLRKLEWSQHENDSDESSFEEQEIAKTLGVSHLPEFSHQAHLINIHLFESVQSILQLTHDSFSQPSSTPKPTAQYLREQLDFVPEIRASVIPSAGRGLFINGRARASEVVAIYPGISYLPSQLRASYPQSKYESLDLSDYMIARYDGVVIDGAAEIVLDLPPSASLSPEDVSHPFANAHLVNHPPRESEIADGCVPNVLQFMIDIHARKLPPLLRQLVPVQPCHVGVSRVDHYENMASRQRVTDCHYFVCKKTTQQAELQPGGEDSGVGSVYDDEDVVYRTVVLVALRDLCDEEMFMNYRFNPKVQHPPWYNSCGDGFDATRRWFPRGAFY